MVFYMPTKIFIGEHCIENHQDNIKSFGEKALIITGQNSSKKNGSLDDVIKILKNNKIESSIYDKIEENPSVETIFEAARKGQIEGSDFIIAIGGGSPLDAAKAIGVIIRNPDCTREKLFEDTTLKSVPIIAIPTTAGTGSEVTPYAILTDHSIKSKRNFAAKIFPDITFLDVRYFLSIPMKITISTAVDALAHLMESYLCVTSNCISEAFVEQGLKKWATCITALKTGELTKKDRENLLLASTLGGMAIAQTGTSLPHGMGYHLTYFHQIEHGKATAIFLPAYLAIFQDQERIETLLRLINIDSIVEFTELIKSLLGKINIKDELIINYSDAMYENKGKLRNHPYQLNREDIIRLYKETLSV